MQAQLIQGTLQNYAWGGTQFLADFTGKEHTKGSPLAEYWMGAHHKGPARIGDTTLDKVIAEAPEQSLGPRVRAQFDDKLPFLFKVLDVQKMLSIQVHPTKEAAEKGFAAEEKNGPERGAPDRNYRDDNHKPELGVAVTDFYLLHGFKSPAAIRHTLREVPGWDELLPHLDSGVRALYRYVMEADQAEIDRLLQPLVDSLRGGDFDRSEADFWAARAVEQYTTEAGHHDRGMFSIYWFNLVQLRPGEGIFQDAGIPHAYLEGVCLELMANSDNVLRGGLTPKHIDVPELLDKTRFETITPDILQPEATTDGWQRYPTPAPDFELTLRRATTGNLLEVPAEDKPAILLLMEGRLDPDNAPAPLTADQRTLFQPANIPLSYRATSDSLLYRAGVGRPIS